MLTMRTRLRRLAFTSLLGLGFLFADRAPAGAQQPHWTGVIADEARPAGTSDSDSQLWTAQNALSGDGRFVVFTTERALLPGDTNDQMDVYLRDRHTGELSRVSVLNTGEQANNASHSASISRDGRFIVFISCGTNLAGVVGGFICEVYVRHREQATTTLISRGPNNQFQTSNGMGAPAISADGRYVLFNGNFEAQPNFNYRYFFVRDRDGDADGTFDEPGESTTTQVSGLTVGDETITWTAWSAISGDGRWVAYTAVTFDNTATHIGDRLFLHDRTNGTTVRVDQPAVANYGQSSFPAFSDTGELVYVTSVNHLVPGDTSANSVDLFVVDLATLEHTQIARPREPWQGNDYEWYPAISANGGYVVYQSNQEVIAYDRMAGTWQTINLHPDGAVDQGWVFLGFPSISADGSAIAFMGTSEMLVNGRIGHHGIFVATAVDVSPSEITATSEVGTYSFDVVVPADVAWTITFKTDTGIDTVTPQSGFGPGSVDVSIFENFSGEPRDHVIGLGSKTITIHQDAGSGDGLVTPSTGSAEGGTEVTIHGSDFQEGAVVRFDGIEATTVTWISDTEIVAVTPPHTPRWVDVAVTNPDASSREFANAFRYVDATAPELTPSITGTLGTNGWYVSEVQVTWTVTDPESEIRWESCPTLTLTYDTIENPTCSAESEGGQADASIEVKRDTELPAILIDSPGAPGTYAVDQAVPVSFTCEDRVMGTGASGLASCSANYQGSLDTSTAGEFVLTITAVDEAGNTTTESIPYTVEKRTPIITWAEPASLTYPAVLSGTQLNATADAPGTLSYSHPLGTALDAGYYELTVTFTPSNPDAYNTVSASVTLEVRPATVTIYWPAAAAITYGTPLTATQLNAEHTAPAGTLVYYPDAGTILDAGTHTLTASYQPENSNYEYAEATISITVLKANPVLSWTNPSSIVYGTALSGTQLNATSNVPGTFSYSPAAGTVLNAGARLLTVTFMPSDATNYNGATRNVIISVSKAPTTITWAAPASITYGTALSATQLNATASVAGSLVYSPAAGTVLNAGTRILNVIFTPSDPNYSSASRNVTIVVGKATPTITWPNPAGITYGTALSATQLNATASAPGTFAYSPAAGTVLSGGTHTLSVTFTPSSPANYNGASGSVSIVVGKVTPTITWPSPAGITYGTALSATQLNASASVAGSFVYSHAAGAVLNAGTQPLTVTFTPSDPANYNEANANVDIVIAKATPAITWTSPAGITYGTALSATQLNATAVVPGSFAYSPAAGAVLDAGTQSLSVAFTPTDAANYHSASGNVDIVVAKATPTITWSNPAGITYGTALSASQLNASSGVPGSFAYAPAGGTVLDAGTHTLSATFTSSNPNYDDGSASVSLSVGSAASSLSWSNPAGITYGTALSDTQLNATGSVAGTLEYSPPAGTVLAAGTHTLTVTLTPSSANYTPSSTVVSITVGARALTVTAANASKVYGEALPVFAISGSGFVNGDTIGSLSGTPSFATSATATSAPGNYSVMPSGVSSANYTITFTAGTLTINKADTTVTLTTSPSPSNNNQNVTMTATLSTVAPGAGTPTGTVEFRDNGTLVGTGTLANGVATLTMKLKKGSHPLTATYAATTNFNGSTGSTTHQVN